MMIQNVVKLKYYRKNLKVHEMAYIMIGIWIGVAWGILIVALFNKENEGDL